MTLVAPHNNIPTILVAFGASGDLMRVKVLPALYHLYIKGELPERFHVIGFSRREWSDRDFRAHVRSVVAEHASGADLERFLELFTFERGDFDEVGSYEAVKMRVEAIDEAWGMCANKLFYLAVAPEYYTTIAKHVAATRLSEPCAPGGGWIRIVVEKPFGDNEETAKKIDEYLASHFREDQIYRIDHYLAKEMLQNILTFRFSNNLFEIPWGKTLIERIDIRVLESIGAETRGSFYDATGTLRDVGQNHFLQMLALLTMEHPQSLDADAIRSRRAEMLRALEVLSEDDVRAHTVRAQYRGFRDIKGVSPRSRTETYFKVRAHIDHPRWKGVPIYMEGGKRLGPAQKEIVVTFKHPMPCLCPPDGPHHTNNVIIRFEPKEEILITFWAKKPGYTLQTEERDFYFLLREKSHRVQYTEEYEKLLLDCIRGDQAFFISTDEIRAMWRYIDPIVAAWKREATPLYSYEPDTRDILDKTLKIID